MNRQPKGIPVGGQFAEMERDEADVELAENEQVPRVMKVTVPASRLRELLHRVELANKRLKRAGLDEKFTFETNETVAQRATGEWVAVTEVTFERPRIGHDGFSIVGVYDFAPDGDPVAAYREDATVGQPDGPGCDQCGKTRRRERIFIVRGEDGEEKQIGRSCLGAFIGITPGGLWALEFDPTAEPGDEGHEDEFDRKDALGNTMDQVYPVDDFMVAVVVTAKAQGGFVPRSRATREQPATVDLLGDPSGALEAAGDEDREKARAVLEWVQAIDPLTDESYLASLRQVLAGSSGIEGRWLRRKHAAMAASAVAAYEREQEIAARKAVAKKVAAEYKPGFLAPKGEKIAPTEATIDFVKPGSTEIGYGRMSYWTLISMVTADGHKVAWFATGDKDVKVGQKVTLTGTVKGHEVREFDGVEVDQTLMTRAKLVDPETGEKLN